MEPEFGIRFQVRWWPQFSTEAELSYQPKYGGGREGNSRGGQKGAFVVGPRYDWNMGTTALFARTRVGIMDFELAPTILAESERLIVSAERPQSAFVLDFGGGVEWRLHQRVNLSIEGGDTVLHFHPEPRGLNPSFYRHNLFIEVGTMLQFGPRLHRR